MKKVQVLLALAAVSIGAVLLTGQPAGASTPAPAPVCQYDNIGSINGLYNRSAAPWFIPPHGSAFTSNDGSLNTLQIEYAADNLNFSIPIIGIPDPAYFPARGVQWDSEYNDREFQRQYDINNECQQSASQQLVRDVSGKVDSVMADLTTARSEISSRFDAADAAHAAAEGRLNTRLDNLSAQVEAVRAQEAANAAANAATMQQVLANQAKIINLLLTPQGQRPGFPQK